MDLAEAVAAVQPVETVTYPILLSTSDVEELSGLKGLQIRAMYLRGDFPCPIKLSTRIFRWDLEEVVEWLDERYSARKVQHCA